ncbi:FecR family protein [Erythrobacter neustonensis]|uniref:FecR protein domain-containing protein n=1 Tax=Erythrobacter neustonensis TaxID=1112 RepID=A0A192D1R1_9SPHN|nr:FecR family protein [Erythrobacter neustonensis]ANK12060.1 hypothetical protein A9D12_02935 [Erythrobacter neustonensis]
MTNLNRIMPRVLLAFLALILGSTPALAQASGWSVSEARGTVTLADASGTRPAKPGAVLAAGTMVRTGAGSSAVLVRGREFVTMRHNAQLRIAPTARERGIVQIIQDYGSALFRIGKQANPHFGVDTPYLAAVVKGTTFVITVSEQGASLQVTEGAVETATLDGGARELIRPGAVAMIAAGDPLRMVIEGQGQRVIDSPARAANTSGNTAPAASATPAPSADAPVSPGGPASSAPEASNGASTNSTEREQARIDHAIVSAPQDLGEMSQGFVSGEVAVIAAAIIPETPGRGGPPTGDGPGQPANGGTPANGNGSGAGAGSGSGAGGGSVGGGTGHGGGASGPGGEGNPSAGDGVVCAGAICVPGPDNGNGNGNGNGSGSGNGNGSSNGAPEDGTGNGNGNGNGNGAPEGGSGGNNGNGDSGSGGNAGPDDPGAGDGGDDNDRGNEGSDDNGGDDQGDEGQGDDGGDDDDRDDDAGGKDNDDSDDSRGDDDKDDDGKGRDGDDRGEDGDNDSDDGKDDKGDKDGKDADERGNGRGRGGRG